MENIKQVQFNIKQFNGGDAAYSLIKILQSHGYIAYLAGGCVRDVLLGRVPKDFDIATDCLPQESVEIFDNAKEIGKAFGVVLINHMRHSFELATFREDFGILNGRHPRKVCFSNPKEDSMRRDFTINSMFYDPISETLYDYNSGEKDLNLKIIRFVGEATQRIHEDHLRMLRAVRFESTLCFDMNESAEEAIQNSSQLVTKLSAERIRDEFIRILCEAKYAGKALKRLNNMNLLIYILPVFSKLSEEEQNLVYIMLDELQNISFELAMTIIFEFLTVEKQKNVNKELKHLKLSAIQQDQIHNVLLNIDAYDNFCNLPLAQKKLLFAESSSSKSINLLELRSKHGLVDEKQYDSANDFFTINKGIELPKPFINGKDLISMGIKPSKKFGTILDSIYKEQLNENLQHRDDAIKMLDGILND